MSNFNTDAGWQPQGPSTATVTAPKSKKGPVQKVRATLLWAELTRTNAMSGKYQVVLTELSNDAVKAIEEKLGVTNIQYNEERGNYVTVKSTFEIEAFDESGNKIEALIGNGSKAIVSLSSFDWNYSGKSGKSLSLVHLTVTDLVEYESQGSAGDGEIF